MDEEPKIPPLDLRTLELTAEAVVAAADDGDIGALVAAAFLRLVRHSNSTCLSAFEESLRDETAPLIGEYTHGDEVFTVANPDMEQDYARVAPRYKQLRKIVEQIKERL